MAKKKEKKKSGSVATQLSQVVSKSNAKCDEVSVAARKRPTKEGLEVLAATLLTLIKMSLGHSADLREMCFE